MRFKVPTAVIFLDFLVSEDDTTAFKTSGITHPMTWCHITEDLNAQNKLCVV
jgi:hypothetical protein